MGALNCFEELTSINWHLNVAISVIGLSLGAKKKIVTNEILQICAFNCVQELHY
jgi:hypothetical protein